VPLGTRDSSLREAGLKKERRGRKALQVRANNSEIAERIGALMHVLLEILSALVDGWAVTGSWKWALVLVAVGAMILVTVMAIQ
jgi:hypothetical protein